jgi:cell shape-determining protein MreC
MTIYDRPPRSCRRPAPCICLAVVLFGSAALMLIPQRWAAPLQQAAQASLRPGLVVAAALRDRTQRLLGVAGNLGSGAERAASLEEEVRQLRLQNDQLQAEVAWLRSQSNEPREDHNVTPTRLLVQGKLIEARVLGRQAQAILQRQGLLDIGSQRGVSPGDLVLDQGAAEGAARGQLVICGGRVWGKVLRTGVRTSIVERATDAGFRDLVRLASGPRGVLEGTGQRHCRLKMVEVTQAVAVGEPVFSEANEGLVEGQLLYGYVDRIEKSPGAAYWEIWVRPAVTQGLPPRVAVLTGEVL